jgi:1,4-alpha-glucan branching enzyme
MQRIPETDLFERRTDLDDLPSRPRLIWENDTGINLEVHDPYCFGSVLDEAAMQHFNSGENTLSQALLGSRSCELEGIAGTLFAVWAPNAGRVSVVGGFNDWDGRFHPMRFHSMQGIWELFIPGLHEGAYKYEIRNDLSGEILLKSDPYARWSEQRPATASLITLRSQHQWQDQGWMKSRIKVNSLTQAISIYEVHLGSWKRNSEGGFLSYRDLAEQICEHVKQLGFTHIELLPMKEHPLDESWGYQSTGYFAPTSRHGTPDDFRAFVDHCHQQNIAVILDWVPAHFPRDEHALARFDGDALYEYHDKWKAEQRDWGTLVFNFERSEVRSFLVSSALHWLKEFHLDGLRVDAVASMLYLNFSRQAEQWTPNKYGGHHNLEAIEFLRQLNQAVRQECPDCLMIAEESSDWHGVTHELETGGLGFHLKWNMGWMHDTLNYLSKDPIYRQHHHDWLTFSTVYAFNENFVLPLSHDEVVHLKKSLFSKMPGDEWQKFANLRLLYSYQWLFPGKQLLFMGGEFAQQGEWDATKSLPWERASHPASKGISQLLSSLNQLQSDQAALRQWDGDEKGFEWLYGNDAQNSVISFVRRSDHEYLVVILNFTPEPRSSYAIPLFQADQFEALYNSDASIYGGADFKQSSKLRSEPKAYLDRPHRLTLDLPPLAALVLKPKKNGN